MYSRLIALTAVFFMLAGEASARSCHVVECEQRRVGEVCTIRPCATGGSLTCVTGRYTEGDGYRWWYGGSRGQCEQRCAADPDCNFLEYYFGSEGVKCNLYSRRPIIRWNSSYDAIVCAWQ